MPEQISEGIFMGAQGCKMQKNKMQWDFHIICNIYGKLHLFYLFSLFLSINSPLLEQFTLAFLVSLFGKIKTWSFCAALPLSKFY